MRLNNKSVGSYMSAITAADADAFIDPDSLISHVTPEERLPTGGLLQRPGWGRKSV